MLKDQTCAAIVPCRDVAAAKRFYIETLGLPLAEDHGDVFAVQTGTSRLNIYKSEFAGTNKPTPWSGRPTATSKRSPPISGARASRSTNIPTASTKSATASM
jgi:catechol 2,3-dioxygenase-like lactoylglutathione lyase family enzyme